MSQLLTVAFLSWAPKAGSGHFADGHVAEAAVKTGGVRVVEAGQDRASGNAASAPGPTGRPPIASGTTELPALVERVNPCVVNITATHQVRRNSPDWPFQYFFGPPGSPRRPRRDEALKERALGSGFVVDSAGHVLTNAHVVDEADEVRVKLADGREFAAKTIGRDAAVDIAVLKLQGATSDLPVASLGSSSALEVGQYVVAIGNPFGLGNTVTLGIVSAKGREIGAGPYDDFIQTDASINPGNSGGPLFNLQGQVVGINTAINPSGQGIGFAIPIDIAKDELQQLITTGRAEHARLGVTVQPVDQPMANALGLARTRGALVADVQSDSPAAHAGIQAGDVILSVDGTEVANAADLPRLVAFRKPGAKLSLGILRAKTERTVTVVLGQASTPNEQGSTDQREGNQDGRLGVAVSDSPSGVVVARVEPDSAADGKLQQGDIITEVNHATVQTASDWERRVREAPRGKPVLLRVERDGTGLFVAIPKA